jgi:colanic acid/amylovoran biosynthesis glycosyltransferase
VKKILFFTSQFPTHSETFVVRQVESLIAKGFDVHILSLLPGDAHISMDADTLAQLNQRRQVVLERKSGFAAKLLYRLTLTLRCLMNKQIRASLNFFQHGRLSTSLLLPSICSELLKHNQTHDYDVIIAHFGNNAVIANKLRQMKLLSGQLFAVFHGFDISSRQLLKQYLSDYQDMFQSDTLALPVSQLWADKLKVLGCPAHKIHVHRMGIDVNKFKFSARTAIAAPPIRILSVARLTEKKGITYALDAIHELVNQGVDVHYKVIGTGPLFDTLSAQIEEKQLGNNVALAGFQNQQSIQLALEEADLFLLPSVTAANGDMEGIPVSLMEAMAKGVLCLSTFHSGIPELITDQHSGLLAPERDSHALAEAIKSLLSRTDLPHLSANARATIETHFNQDKLSTELAELIEHGHEQA